MSNAAARTCLRQGLARSQTRGISYDVVRTSIVGVAAAPTYQRYSRSPLVSTPPRSPLDLPHSTRAFHTSPAVYKSKKKEDAGRGKSNGKHAESSSSSSASDSTEDGPKHPQPNPEEPLDFADVESRLTRHAEHFKGIFKKLHTGGRFDPDVVGALRVTVDRKAGDAYPLRELAQVVPRGGRAVSLLAHEAAYVKPIMSAVQASPEFNQQPQRDPDNELELVLRIEPERPEDLVRRAKAVANEWRDRVRSARQRRDKQHVTWKKEGALGPDLKRTADKELDKVIKAAMTEIDEVEKSAVKAAESK